MITGSINVTKLLEAVNAGHSCAIKGKKSGDIYVNVLVWENDEPDDNGDDFSVQLNSKKEEREKADSKEKKAIYIGNLRRLQKGGGKPEEKEAVAPGEVNKLGVRDDLPF